MARPLEVWNRWRSLVRSDFERNGTWDSRLTAAVWRMGQVADRERTPAGFLLRRAHTLVDQVWVRAVVGAELPRTIDVGPGVRLPHAGRGIVLHPDARIGAGVTIYHRVTVGVSGTSGPPVIGDGAYLGTGAVVIGDVTVGAGAKVGANAVVVKDVPPGATAVGVPSRILHGSPQLDLTVTAPGTARRS